MKRLGIDTGSLFTGCVLLEDGVVKAFEYRAHRGDVAGTVRALLEDERFRIFDLVGVATALGQPSSGTLDPLLSVIEGARHLIPSCRNVMSIGGQTFSLIFYDDKGEYREHSTNPPCASGTGSFLEQQAERLGVSVEELAARADACGGNVPAIATRCAVFAKTDIVHAMQEGYSVDAVCAGLCDGIAQNLIDALVKGRELKAPLGVVGGGSLNTRIVKTLARTLGVPVEVPPKGHLAGAVGAALLAEHPAFPQGAFSSWKGKARMRNPLRMTLSSYPDSSAFTIRRSNDVEVFLPKDGFSGERGAAQQKPGDIYAGIDIGSTSTKIAVVEGTSGDEDRRGGSFRFLGGFYTSTGGDPIAAMKRLVRELERVFDPSSIAGAATTGSGRKLVKELFSADMEVDEITAHAKAAVFLHPLVDTIIEIGGQDSKFTRLRDGEVYFSTMNYACAAGTGSFIEEQAKRLVVSLKEFSDLAFGSSAPYTSDRCTVYMERDLAALLSEGWTKRALAAAVLNSVRDNYVAKVVGRSSLGNHVVFQGATARNKALVASFEQLLGKPVSVSPYCHLTGAFGAALLCAESPHEGLIASGPSLLPSLPARSSFMWEAFEESARSVAIERETCDLCANRCLLTVTVRGGIKTAWGMKCGREYESASRKRPVVPMPMRRFFDAMKPLMATPAGAGARPAPGAGEAAAAAVRSDPEAGGTPGPEETHARRHLERRRVTVGLSPALYGVEYALLWHAFLTRLGFTVTVEGSGRSSSRQALSMGKGIVNSDFCAPMIAAHGSIRCLLDRKVDYVFFPAVMSEEDEREREDPLYRKKTRDAYFCYYSQYLPTIVSKLTSVDLGGRLISPLLSLNGKTPEEIALDIHAEMAKTFPGLSREETVKAFTGAYDLFNERRRSIRGYFHSRTVYSEYATSLESEPVGNTGDSTSPHGLVGAGTRVVLLGRPYVVLDPALNLDIPRTLEERGAEIFWQDEFDLDGEPLLYANRYYERMHWHFGKKILKVAEHCARTENLYAVFITCFRCSPDSFLMSYLKDIMDHYGKPFLFLQLDEHSSDVGYTTRIEAALRTFAAHRRREIAAAAAPREPVAGETPESAGAGAGHGVSGIPEAAATRPRNDRLEKGDTVLVPYLDRLISRFYADSFIRAGYDALVLEADEKALSTGYQYASGGECMPLVSIMGGAIEKTRSMDLDPAKTFFFLPTSCYACNFPQFPILSDLAFQSAGLEGLKVGLLNSMSLGEGLSQSLAAKIFESGIAAGVLHKIYNRVKPYEVKKGETEAAFRQAERSMSEAILSGRDLRGALSTTVETFRRIERDETKGRKARIELLGDLYVKYSEAVNRNLQAFVEELGGELLLPSMTEYALHYYYADIRHSGDDPRHYDLLRAIERRYEKIAADLIGDQLEPDLAECARLMDEERFTHYITGETSINVGRALHAIRRGTDAILHANPIFCCPGVVSSSIFRRVQEDSGVPIVDLFYDGTGNPNRLLIPHLYYLNRRRERLHD